MADGLPLLERFPALARLPRAGFVAGATPVDRLALGDGRVIWVKRDDLSGREIGGNKVRGLDWLLGDLHPGETVLTAGSRGSTHALSTAVCAGALGARTTVVQWDQQMNPAAVIVERRLRTAAKVIRARSPVLAYAVATVLRMRGGVRWIPAGGATPLALLGHVNAALELCGQVARGECDAPDAVVVPLGTGGTAAGLALGFRIGALRTRVLAVRVVPRIVGRAGRVRSLAGAAARLIERLTGERLPRPERDALDVEHAYYAGAYGAPLPPAPADRDAAAAGVTLDDTYGRKAFAAAVAAAASRRRVLLWLTFDGRLLQD